MLNFLLWLLGLLVLVFAIVYCTPTQLGAEWLPQILING